MKSIRRSESEIAVCVAAEDPHLVTKDVAGWRKPFLGQLAAGIVLLWALLDIGGRLGPVHWLHILPELEASRRPGRWHPFRPNISILYDPWVGEAAITGNLRPTERRPPVRFSTDDFGFRLTPGLDLKGDVDLIFFEGASFVYGGALSDDETLPAMLTQKGLKTYNGAHPWWIPMQVDSLEWLINRLGHGRRAVGMLCWETSDFWPQPTGNEQGHVRVGQTIAADRYGAAVDTVLYARNFTLAALRISPLQILSIRAFKWLSNDVLLPNRYKAAIESHTTPDGRQILFTDTEIRRVTEPPNGATVVRHAEYFGQLARRLSHRNLDTYVILLPNRYNVYGPLVDKTRPNKPSGYLTSLERELTRRNIPTLNVEPVMRLHAMADLATGRLAYFREDHHWTAIGVQRVAKAFAAFVANHGRSTNGASVNAVQ